MSEGKGKKNILELHINFYGGFFICPIFKREIVKSVKSASKILP